MLQAATGPGSLLLTWLEHNLLCFRAAGGLHQGSLSGFGGAHQSITDIFSKLTGSSKAAPINQNCNRQLLNGLLFVRNETLSISCVSFVGVWSFILGLLSVPKLPIIFVLVHFGMKNMGANQRCLDKNDKIEKCST